MNGKARQKQLPDHLWSVAAGAILDLIRLSGASNAAIRRDLLELHQLGEFIRTPGGAVTTPRPLNR